MPEPSPARTLACTVAARTQVAPDLFRMSLRCPELAASLEPGQFFNLRVPGDPTHLLRVPFSWARADREAGEVEFAFAVVGEGTRRLAELPLGTQTDLLGPAGKGWKAPEGCTRALFVAGGTGTVALVPMACALACAGVACDFVEGQPTAERMLFEEEVVDAGAAFMPVTEDGSRGFAGDAAQAAAGMLEDGAYDVVYVCGPEEMMAKVAAAAKAAGVPCQVSMERLMACGFGACTTCLVDTVEGRKGACKEGPVFDAEKVIW